MTAYALHIVHNGRLFLVSYKTSSCWKTNITEKTSSTTKSDMYSTVSYTHLDVYKRQPIYILVIVITVRIQLLGNFLWVLNLLHLLDLASVIPFVKKKC